MSILDVLPSLRNAAPCRFDRALWPSTTECYDGRVSVDGALLDDAVDAAGSAVIVHSCERSGARTVTVCRVLAVETLGRDTSRVLVAGGPSRRPLAAAALTNRHPLGPLCTCTVVTSRSVLGTVSLPDDVRAGDVLAMVGPDGHAVCDVGSAHVSSADVSSADVNPGPPRHVLLRSA